MQRIIESHSDLITCTEWLSLWPYHVYRMIVTLTISRVPNDRVSLWPYCLYRIIECHWPYHVYRMTECHSDLITCTESLSVTLTLSPAQNHWVSLWPYHMYRIMCSARYAQNHWVSLWQTEVPNIWKRPKITDIFIHSQQEFLHDWPEQDRKRTVEQIRWVFGDNEGIISLISA